MRRSLLLTSDEKCRDEVGVGKDAYNRHVEVID